MAIAGLLIMAEAAHAAAVQERLRAEPDVVEVRATEDPARLAVVLETASDRVEAAMTALLQWEGVLAVDMAFVSYEDDLDATGGIACPPHKPRKHQGQRTE